MGSRPLLLEGLAQIGRIPFELALLVGRLLLATRKLSTQAPVGSTAYWNTYPVAGQTTTNVADGTGNRLPYEIVATQQGVTPGAVGTTP